MLGYLVKRGLHENGTPQWDINRRTSAICGGAAVNDSRVWSGLMWLVPVTSNASVTAAVTSVMVMVMIMVMMMMELVMVTRAQ